MFHMIVDASFNSPDDAKVLARRIEADVRSLLKLENSCCIRSIVCRAKDVRCRLRAADNSDTRKAMNHSSF